MAASGLVYTVSFNNISLSNNAQNIWELITSATVPILIHSLRLTVQPSIVSGVAQDYRAQLSIQRISTTGTGGTARTPVPLNSRNTVAASTTCNSMVTTPGTAGSVLDSELVSIIVPFERIYTPDQRIPVPAGTRIALNLAAGLTSSYPTSSEIYFEEI